MKPLDQVTQADLTTCNNLTQMAQAEGWTPDRYALELSERIRATCVPLDMQRERLAALAQVVAGLVGDQASADELSRHGAILTAIFERFARTSAELAAKDPIKHAEASERYLNSALKAQRGAVLVLSAIKAIRDSQPKPA